MFTFVKAEKPFCPSHYENTSPLFFIILTILFLSLTAFAARTTATSSGNWNSSGTWDNGVPGCGDTVIINPSVVVTVTDHVDLDESSSPACSTAIFIEVKGELHFNTGKKLYIPCGSAVYVESGGSLTKGSGGGNSNLVDVCGSTIWNAGDGSLTGPQWVGSPLPITLEFFQAENVSDAIELSWATQSEINNDFFTIERSTDLSKIEDIFIISGAGSSRSRLEYKEFDVNPPKGHIYYRLKQTDFDGTYTHSQWVSTRVEGSNVLKVKVFPTFVEAHINISIDNALNRSGEIRIFDAKGALLYHEKMDIISDSYVWSSTEYLNHQGMAYIKVHVDGKEYADRLFYSKR